jgi:hypothetical protein
MHGIGELTMAMTVKELIRELLDCDLDKEVYVVVNEDIDTADIDSIEEWKDAIVIYPKEGAFDGRE